MSQGLRRSSKIKCISFNIRLKMKTLFLVDTEMATTTTATTTTAALTTTLPKKCEWNVYTKKQGK